MAKKKHAFLYRILRYPFIAIIHIMFFPKAIDRNNIPKKGPAIIACNHKNFFDALILAKHTRRTVFFLSKMELHRGKFKSWFFKSCGAIPVDRKNKDEAARCAAVEVLEAGEVIGIFPEGTRNYTGDVVMPFKFGAVSFAQKTGAPIIPTAITGEYVKFNPKTDLKIRYGKPIYIDKNIPLEEANQLLQNTIANMLIEDGVKK